MTKRLLLQRIKSGLDSGAIEPNPQDEYEVVYNPDNEYLKPKVPPVSQFSIDIYEVYTE